MSDLDARLSSERMLVDSCEMIARISRLSQLKPEITGMTIEEVSEFIKLTADKATAKYEKMSLIDVMLDMVREVASTEGGENA